MSSLNSIAELSFRQLFPNPSDETKLKKEDFMATAYTEYAAAMWLMAKEEKREEGVFNVPSHLLAQSEPLIVEDNRIDTSELRILRGLPNEIWLQNVGGVGCDCQYVKSNMNQTQLLCDDDSLGGGARTYYIMGNRILFPQGTHKKKLPIVYAKTGEDINGDIQVDDIIGKIVRDRLLQIYQGKIGQADPTNNSNPES